jgi:porin
LNSTQHCASLSHSKKLLAAGVVGVALAIAPALALADGGATPAPIAQASDAPAPAPTLAPGLLGDWGGSRESLAQKGITVYGGITDEAATMLNGGNRSGTANAGQFAIGTNIDFGQLNPGSGAGTLHFLFTQRYGSSLATSSLGSLISVQEIYGAGLTDRLSELDYAQPLFDNKLNVEFGRVVMQNDFITGGTYWGQSVYCLYQNNGFCGTGDGVPNNSGWGYAPTSQWGARVKFTPSGSFYMTAGGYQVNPVYGLSGQGFNLSTNGDTGMMFPFETGAVLRNKDGAKVGDVSVGGYYDTSNVLNYESYLSKFVAPNNPALTAVPQTFQRGRDGAWFQFDHLLSGSAAPGQPGTMFFTTYEFGDPQTALFSSFVDAGIARHGTFAGRPNDILAFGYTYNNINPRLRTFEQELQGAGYAVPLNGVEQALELNYSAQLTPWLVLRPGIQYVMNPSGESYNVNYPGGIVGPKNGLVFGLGTGITF